MMQGSLARKLRVLRAERGLSLTDAAERAGVTRDTVSNLERGKRHAYTPTLSKIAKGYGVPVEELLEEPVPLAEAPREAGQLGEPRPQVWAREIGARLHGMSDEEWIHHVRALESVEELVAEWRTLGQEAGILRDALRLDKWQRPEDRERRIELSRSLRELRAHRYGDLAVEAQLREAGELAQRLWETIREEAAERIK